MKFCKDCKHYTPGKLELVCSHDRALRPQDPVTGISNKRPCSLMRHLNGLCGPDAALFEPAGVPVMLKFTCCDACHAEHANLLAARLHWLWLRATRQA